MVVTFLLGLPALYLGWVALQGGGRPESLVQIADELASRLRSQWAKEAEARGLYDPYPLPVTWTAADAPRAGDLDTLKTLATSGFGWSASARESWARGPEDLAGGGDKKLADVLAAVPTGRLVVLGEPGTGKTMLMVGLVLDLLHPDRRSSGGPVPVLAPLASWDPGSQDLHDWLGAMLITGYPNLAAAPPRGTTGDNRFEALLEAGLILPVLDGLDELPDQVRGPAISQINKGLKPGEQLVITCRTEQYQAAVSPPGDQGTALRAAAVVQLSTLPFAEVARYLRKDAGPAGEDRWNFLNTLSTDSPVREALSAPLMVGLARVIYNPRPGELARTLRDPAELCSPALADQKAVESLLFDEFIPAAYRNDPRARWKAQDAERWLVFLARHLERNFRSTPDLAWWQLQEAIPGTVFGYGAGGLGAGLVAGLAIAIGVGAGFGVVVGVVVGVLFGVGVGVVVGLALRDGVPDGPPGVPGELAKATSPQAVLVRNRRAALRIMVVVGAGFALWVGDEVGRVAAGVGFGVAAGIAVSMVMEAWPSYLLTRGWLAFNHRLPWSLMSFLADAHRRGVLRQAGAVYQFRHIELQRRLATRPYTRSRYQLRRQVP